MTMMPLEICDRLDRWWSIHPDPIEAARRVDPVAAVAAARTIVDRLERLRAEVEPVDPKRVDADLRVMLNALLQIPTLGRQLPTEFDEYLLGGNIKADPSEYQDVRARLHAVFEPIAQKLDPHLDT